MPTYTSGLDLKFKQSLSKSEYMMLCDRLGIVLSDIAGINGHEDRIIVVPEPITEGGFKLCGGPGGIYGTISGYVDGKVYKTMRHFIGTNKYGVTVFIWPWITPTTQGEWRHSDAIIIREGMIASTTLKAFIGAPEWTLAELRACKGVFEEFGIQCTNTPRAKDLK